MTLFFCTCSASEEEKNSVLILSYTEYRYMNFSFQRQWQHKINTTNFITFDYWVWLLLLKYIYLECFLIDFVSMRSVKRKRLVLKHYVNHNHLKRGHPNNNLQADMIMIIIALLQEACLLGTGKILIRTLDTKDFTLGKQDHLSVWDILLLLLLLMVYFCSVELPCCWSPVP